MVGTAARGDSDLVIGTDDGPATPPTTTSRGDAMTDETTPPPAGDGPDRPDQGTTATASPPDPTPTPARPVFRRSSTDKVLGGVAGGLARTFDQDPVVVRIITVVLSLVFPPAFVGPSHSDIFRPRTGPGPADRAAWALTRCSLPDWRQS